MILSKRPKDDDNMEGFTKWPFMSTHMWAENPRGRWKLIIIVDSDEDEEGVLLEWTLVLHGTTTSPYVSQKADIDKRHPKLRVVKREHELGRNFRF
jgi:proprotein convertase subtilisin/kexin type 2